jgi:NitT/TauT family transport system substrate-binding protein
MKRAKIAPNNATVRTLGRWLGAFSLGLASLFVMSGCAVLNGSSTPSNAPANPNHLEKSVINVGVLPIVTSVVFYAALHEGYFTREGLTVNPVMTQTGSQTIPKLQSGGLDITLSNDVTAIQAEYRGTADLRFLVPAYQSKPGTFVVVPAAGSGINGAQDLAGKTIAVNTTNDIVTLGLQEDLEANDVPLTDVHFVVVAYDHMEQALATHQVDAAAMQEPYKTEAAQDSKVGTRPILDIFGSGPVANLEISSYIAKWSFVARNPRTVTAFREAMAKAVAAVGNNRQELEKELLTFTKISPQTAALINFATFPDSESKPPVERVVDAMSTFNLVPAHYDIARMILPAPHL